MREIIKAIKKAHLIRPFRKILKNAPLSLKPEIEYILNSIVNNQERFKGYGMIVDGKLSKHCLISAAVEHGNLELTQFLYEQDEDKFENSWHTLQKASLIGHLDIVQYIIENKYHTPNQLNESLLLSAEHGRFEVFKYLIEYGCDINYGVGHPIRIAAEYGNLEIVKYLVEQGAEIHVDRDNPILSAADYNRLDIIHYFIMELDEDFPESTFALLKEADTEGSRYALNLLEARDLAKSLERSLAVKKEQPQRRTKI